MNPALLMNAIGRAQQDPGLPVGAKIFLGILAAGTVVTVAGMATAGVVASKGIKVFEKETSRDDDALEDRLRAAKGVL